MIETEVSTARRCAAAGLAMLAIAVAGCGEAGKQAVGQNAQTGATTQSAEAPATTTTVGSQSAGSGESGAHGNGASQPTGGAAHAVQSTTTGATTQPHAPRSHRAHLVLPGPNSRPAPRLNANQRANVSVADITLSSSGIRQPERGAQSVLSSRYTCQGADTPPPLRWTGVPAGTAELALFVLNTQPVGGKLFFDWAVAGLPGDLRELNGSRLPAGAVIGRNSLGRDSYSLCPSGGKSETYLFVLYALPHKLSAATGFDPTSMRASAISLAHHSGILFGAYG